MPQVGFRIGAEELSFDEALERAERGQLPYPPALLRSLFNGRRDKQPSPSSVAGCLRAFELKRLYDFYLRPEDSLAAFMGTAAHAALAAEGQDSGDSVEQYLSADLDLPDLEAPYDRVRFGGTCDHIAGDLIRDWKTKRYIPASFEPAPGHIVQVNIYGWLAAVNGYNVKRYELVYLDQSKVMTFRGDLTDPAKVQLYVEKRIREWALASSVGQLVVPLTGFADAKP